MTPPPIHDSDRKAAEEITESVNDAADGCLVIASKKAAESFAEIIARHHAEERTAYICPIGQDAAPSFCSAGTCFVCMKNALAEVTKERAAVQKVREALENAKFRMIAMGWDNNCYYPENIRVIKDIDTALTALRTANQSSPTDTGT